MIPFTPTMKQNNHKCSKIQGLQQTTRNAISCITLFRFITILCGTDDIPCSITGYSPHSLPQNTGMDLNNIMWVIVEVFVVLFVCLPPPFFGVFLFCFFGVSMKPNCTKSVIHQFYIVQLVMWQPHRVSSRDPSNMTGVALPLGARATHLG